jgi:bifunctional non-homologous end joining protein LigD
MLATAAPTLPVGEGWAYEFKWDGVRVIANVSAKAVRLSSRAENEVTTAYPEIVAGLAGAGPVQLDGEVVAFVDGRPSFEALQSRMHVRVAADARALAITTPATFVVFDVLSRAGRDLTRTSYSERRAELEAWFATTDSPSITLSPSFSDGPATEAAARQHDLEGVVAKRLTSKYLPGTRSADWHKLRFVRTGDFVVIGAEAPATGSKQLSSLVLARHHDGDLRFAGKVGSGISGAIARQLTAALTFRHDCPIAEQPPSSPGRVVRWVEPDVVVEVEYSELTTDGRLRHPVYRRLRTDKSSDEAEGGR